MKKTENVPNYNETIKKIKNGKVKQWKIEKNN